ncbi:hypothetical protein [Nitrosomonas communis]|uniref:YD repeat-containing protein n=1 Tax=Nitrosomonas communis TaxID=44574 RepID=A0A1I4TCZ0_9PROT|nr:hypothetical protein [Nitrosomonas communis]SFM74483.1 hypothetical protein SAMN05421863_104920 [Nitrosomonas communis]
MFRILSAIVLMIGFIQTGAADKAKNETRIYHTDSIGTVITDKPSYIIQKDGRILPTDSIGTRDAGSQNQYRIIGDRIYETDSIGTVRPERSPRIK